MSRTKTDHQVLHALPRTGLEIIIGGHEFCFEWLRSTWNGFVWPRSRFHTGIVPLFVAQYILIANIVCAPQLALFCHLLHWFAVKPEVNVGRTGKQETIAGAGPPRGTRNLPFYLVGLCVGFRLQTGLKGCTVVSAIYHFLWLDPKRKTVIVVIHTRPNVNTYHMKPVRFSYNQSNDFPAHQSSKKHPTMIY